MASRKLYLTFAIFLIILLPLLARSGTLAITGATIIDGTGSDPIRRGVVLLTDDRITAVGASRAVEIPESATRIDARGKYVIPGLMDANLHLFLNIDLETLIKYEGRYHEIILEAAQITLRTGQTTVFDTWGPRAALVQARDMIKAGDAPDSRIYLAGNIIGFGGPLSPDFRAAAAPFVSKMFAKKINDTWEQETGRDLMWMGPEEVRTVIREYAGKEVDLLKYGASGHVDMNFIVFSPRVQKVIVEEGHRAGVTVQTHTTTIESLDMAIDAGVDIITHGGVSGPKTFILEETLQKLVDRGIAVSVLSITQKRLDAMLEKADENRMAEYMNKAKTNHRNMIEVGVTMLVSTDAGIENPVLSAEAKNRVNVDPRTKLGEGHFNAMAALQEMGMKPMEILKSATSHIARAYKLDSDIGTLEAGKLADLVILDKNPLADAKNYRSIHSVIKAGEIIDLKALPVSPIISSMKPPK